MTAGGAHRGDPEAAGPLAGVKVVDLTINVMGPAATQILGDMGAEVIKIESPEGDPMRRLGPHTRSGMAPHFLGFNRNKRSVVLDLKHPPALEALMRLGESTALFVHTMRFTGSARLRLGPPPPRPRQALIGCGLVDGGDGDCLFGQSLTAPRRHLGETA